MNSSRFLPYPPEPYKTRLSTVVDAFTEHAQPLELTSTLGKRRLFRHRIWAESVGAGKLSIKVFPGWLYTRPSGRIGHFIHDVIPEGTLEQYIEETQARWNVHLWMAPIVCPTHWPRGNWVSGYALHGALAAKGDGHVIPFTTHASALYVEGLIGSRAAASRERAVGA